MSTLFFKRSLSNPLSKFHQPAFPFVTVVPVVVQRRAYHPQRGGAATTRDVDNDFPVTPPKPPTPPSPLAVLPAKNLFRSLFISFVSSRSWLLTPSIYILDILCRPKGLLLNVERNKPLAWVLKQVVYNQFCTGETLGEVRETLAHLKSLGFKGTILTYAKEIVFDNRFNEAHGADMKGDGVAAQPKCPIIEKWRDGAIESSEMLEHGDQLAIKLTGAGPLVIDAFTAGKVAPPQMMDALHAICNSCKERGIGILVDAESQRYQAGIDLTALELMRTHNRNDHAVVHNTYQAYLKSTFDVICSHLEAASKENFTMGLKVVRGAYITTEKRSLIHDTKKDTDDNYNGIAQGALRRCLGRFGAEGGVPFPSLNLLLAGHNMETIVAARQLNQQRVRDGMPTVPVAFAQLQGMADRVSFLLLHMKDEAGRQPNVFKCSTWGTLPECLGYLSRRARENYDAASRTMEEYKALKSEVWRRVRALSFKRSP